MDFNKVASVMHELGFLMPSVTQEQEKLFDDIYVVFKCSKH